MSEHSVAAGRLERQVGSTALPFEVPTPAEVTFASPAIVKRRTMSYGKPGALLLSAGRLTFLTADPATSWQVPVADIARLRRPWYGMGSYLTFRVSGAYYAFAFGRRGLDLGRITSVSGLAIRYGGGVGTGVGLVGDAIALSALADGARLGGEWFTRLRAASSARADSIR